MNHEQKKRAVDRFGRRRVGRSSLRIVNAVLASGTASPPIAYSRLSSLLFQTQYKNGCDRTSRYLHGQSVIVEGVREPKYLHDLDFELRLLLTFNDVA